MQIDGTERSAWIKDLKTIRVEWHRNVVPDGIRGKCKDPGAEICFVYSKNSQGAMCPQWSVDWWQETEVRDGVAETRRYQKILSR